MRLSFVRLRQAPHVLALLLLFLSKCACSGSLKYRYLNTASILSKHVSLIKLEYVRLLAEQIKKNRGADHSVSLAQTIKVRQQITHIFSISYFLEQQILNYILKEWPSATHIPRSLCKCISVT